MAVAGRVVLKLPARIVGAGNITVTLTNGVYYIQDVTTTSLVTDLPTGSVLGARQFVSDATVRNFGTIPIGGGTFAVPVYYDGSNWRIG